MIIFLRHENVDNVFQIQNEYLATDLNVSKKPQS